MIRFSLRQLEYFIAAAQEGGTLQAARALNVSQPSVSRAIGELESTWNTRLFVRQHARGLLLTSEGEQRYRQCLKLLRDAQSIGQTSGIILQGNLSIGCFDFLGPMIFPAVMRLFNRAHPAVNLLMRESNHAQLLEWVADGVLELALIYDNGVTNANIDLHTIGSQPPYALVSANHRLAKRDTLRMADLEDEPFILINLPHSKEYFLSLFNSAGVRLQVVSEVRSLEMARALVANDHGISILVTRPHGDIAYDGNRLVCLPLVDAQAPQNIVLASASDIPLSPIGQAFISAARKYLTTLEGANTSTFNP